MLAAVACTFSALSYAELASSIPVSGSAYTYAYATLGEIVAWIIGWDLILEYGVSVAAVAVGWGGNFNVFLDAAFGVQLPDAIVDAAGGGRRVQPARRAGRRWRSPLLLVRGVRESARVNFVMVGVKLLALTFFIVVAMTSFSTKNFTPVLRRGDRQRDHRGGDHLLRVHRVRRGLHRQRGGPATRSATCRSRSSAR